MEHVEHALAELSLQAKVLGGLIIFFIGVFIGFFLLPQRLYGEPGPAQNTTIRTPTQKSQRHLMDNDSGYASSEYADDGLGDLRSALKWCDSLATAARTPPTAADFAVLATFAASTRSREGESGGYDEAED